MKVGILHPGAMGAALAGSISGDTLWVGAGRSTETRERARQMGLIECESLQEMIEMADVVLSVCPPAAALDVAAEVGGEGFEGVFADLNAVAPTTAREISTRVSRFVDGGVVGRPPSAGDQIATRVYLSGPEAHVVAGLFEGDDVDARVIGREAGKASALKMAYGGWTKGSSALLLALAAFAEDEGVREALAAEWDESIPGLSERLEDASARVGPKAWRFAGEMDEVARAMRDVEMPPGFHEAAQDVFDRLASMKGAPEGSSVEEVLWLLLANRDGTGPV